MSQHNIMDVLSEFDEALPGKLFSYFFHKIPNHIRIDDIKGLEFLKQPSKGPEESLLHQFKAKRFSGAGIIRRSYDLTLVFSTEEVLIGSRESLTFLYHEERLFSERTLLEQAKAFRLSGEKKKSRIQLIMPSKRGLDLKHFACDTQPTDLSLNYNDDMPAFHADFMGKLDAKNTRGLHFLYGRPGTGKTHYLRHVISQTEKDVIYIPSGMAEVLANPAFLQLLIEARGDVLIIEDAEKAIISRDSSYNNAVATLLNISDGLLSDVLNMQIICTFNTDLQNVDKALLRPGRLLSRYEFAPLAPAKARALSAALSLNQPVEHPMTLAEVYAGQEAPEVSLTTRRGAGF